MFVQEVPIVIHLYSKLLYIKVNSLTYTVCPKISDPISLLLGHIVVTPDMSLVFLEIGIKAQKLISLRK